MKRISIIALTIILLLTGCTVGETGMNSAKQDYSFENSDVIAYVDGEPVSEVPMNNYIVMKKAYMKALADSLDEYTVTEELMFTEKMLYRWNVERTSDIKQYSEKDWVKDYYKSIFLGQRFDESDMYTEEQLEYDVNSRVNDILESQKKNNDGLSGLADAGLYVEEINAGVDEAVAVQAAADEIGITFEECLNTVYKPFLISDYKYAMLLNTFYDELDYGKKVEYADANESEYVDFVIDTMRLNRDYLNSLFERAEVVERPA